MQQIQCPWCGPRAQIEFEFCRVRESVGDPVALLTVSEAMQKLYLRENPVGEQLEIWQHTGGCRGWLQLRRSNLTHHIHASMALGPGLPE